MTYQEFAQRWSEIVQYPCEITKKILKRVIQENNTDSSLPSRSEGHPQRGKGEIFNIFQDPIIKEIREMDGDYHDDVWKFYQSYLKTHPNGGSEEERREFIKTVANVYLYPARLQQIKEEEEAKKK